MTLEYSAVSENSDMLMDTHRYTQRKWVKGTQESVNEHIQILKAARIWATKVTCWIVTQQIK